MQYTTLGNTGLQVSRLCLGCMSYGEPTGGRHDWALSEDEARPFFERSLDAGINFFDTANAYSAGASERILGRAIADLANRDEMVIATKVFFPMGKGRNMRGLSRKAIHTAIDASLERLGMDHVDLYQIHRWDDETPIEETMTALHELVVSGKVRYLGASSMWAWQFAKAQYTADRLGLTRFVAMQNHYNLLNREEEREMLPLCVDMGVGVIPWSPLGRGRLARPWDTTTSRSEIDSRVDSLFDRDRDEKIVDLVGEIADHRGLTRAQVALAWMLSKYYVTAPIIGATKLHQLEEAIGALEVELTDDEITSLEELYQARAQLSDLVPVL